MEKYEIVKEIVTNYFHRTKFESNLQQLYANEVAQVIDMGTQILLAKWEIVPAYGSFIEAFTENKLKQTFDCADSVNRKAIYFYLLLTYNVGMPRELAK